MKRALTAAFVESVKPPEPGKRLDIWDSKLTGFALRVTETGAKSWCVLYRHQGRFRRLTIGSTAKFGLADARAVLQQLVGALPAGPDLGHVPPLVSDPRELGDLGREVAVPQPAAAYA